MTRTATLYLLQQNPELLRITSDYGKGKTSSAQLTAAVVETMTYASKKFRASGNDISELLQKHAAAALPRN